MTIPTQESESGDLQPLMQRIKAAADGMLPLAVYEHLYRSAASCGGGTLVEIGTARGAATIALALGARSSGLPFHLYTVDPFLGPRQSKTGSPERNALLAKRLFDSFDVARDITLVVGETPDLVPRLNSGPVSLLFIDADGRIDRDLALLLGRLAPEAPVIIDDVDDRTYVHREAGGLRIDQKHRLSHLLTDLYCEAGLLTVCERIFQTGVYRKGSQAADADAIRAAALPAYRQLVNVTVHRREFSRLLALRRTIVARLPFVSRLSRVVRGG